MTTVTAENTRDPGASGECEAQPTAVDSRLPRPLGGVAVEDEAEGGTLISGNLGADSVVEPHTEAVDDLRRDDREDETKAHRHRLSDK